MVKTRSDVLSFLVAVGRRYGRVMGAGAIAFVAMACSGKENPATAAGGAGGSDTVVGGGGGGGAGGGGFGGGFDAGSGDPCAANPTCTTRAVTTGNIFSCAVSGDGRLKCWGDNYHGKLGLGDAMPHGDGPDEMGTHLPVVDLGAGRKVVAVAAGKEHACAVFDNGQVKCWGDNISGQLGIGDVGERGSAAGQMGDNLPAVDLGTGRTAKAVGGGYSHSCALLDNGQVKCWGDNTGGQLGIGDRVNRGDKPGQLGDSLPAVDLGMGRTALAVATGGNHTCALLDDRTMKCWGLNHSGQLGLGDVNDRGDVAGEMGDALPAVSLGTGLVPVVIAAGGAHTCAALDDGEVKCWGDFSAGQLGLGDSTYRGKVPSDMGDNLPAVDLGAGRRGIFVAAGPEHTCAILGDRQVKCWGLNFGGNLGIGDTELRGRSPDDMGDNLPVVSLGTGRSVFAISVGSGSNCAVLDDDQIKCWGENHSGELGLGDMTNHGEAPGQMGDALPNVVVW